MLAIIRGIIKNHNDQYQILFFSRLYMEIGGVSLSLIQISQKLIVIYNQIPPKSSQDFIDEYIGLLIIVENSSTGQMVEPKSH